MPTVSILWAHLIARVGKVIKEMALIVLVGNAWAL